MSHMFDSNSNGAEGAEIDSSAVQWGQQNALGASAAAADQTYASSYYAGYANASAEPLPPGVEAEPLPPGVEAEPLPPGVEPLPTVATPAPANHAYVPDIMSQVAYMVPEAIYSFGLQPPPPPSEPAEYSVSSPDSGDKNGKTKLLLSKALAKKRLAAFSNSKNSPNADDSIANSKKSTLLLPTISDTRLPAVEIDKNDVKTDEDSKDGINEQDLGAFMMSRNKTDKSHSSSISKPKFSLVRFTQTNSPPPTISEKKGNYRSPSRDANDDEQKVVVEWKKMSDKSTKSLRSKKSGSAERSGSERRSRSDRDSSSDSRRSRSRDRYRSSRSSRRRYSRSPSRSRYRRYNPRHYNRGRFRRYDNYNRRHYRSDSSPERGRYGSRRSERSSRRGRSKRSSSSSYSRSPSPRKGRSSRRSRSRSKSPENNRSLTKRKDEKAQKTVEKGDKKSGNVGSENPVQVVANYSSGSELEPAKIETAKPVAEAKPAKPKPAEPMTMLVNGYDDRDIKWPFQFIKYTKTVPSLAYSCKIQVSLEAWSKSVSNNDSDTNTPPEPTETSLIADKPIVPPKMEKITIAPISQTSAELISEIPYINEEIPMEEPTQPVNYFASESLLYAELDNMVEAKSEDLQNRCDPSPEAQVVEEDIVQQAASPKMNDLHVDSPEIKSESDVEKPAPSPKKKKKTFKKIKKDESSESSKSSDDSDDESESADEAPKKSKKSRKKVKAKKPSASSDESDDKTSAHSSESDSSDDEKRKKNTSKNKKSSRKSRKAAYSSEDEPEVKKVVKKSKKASKSSDDDKSSEDEPEVKKVVKKSKKVSASSDDDKSSDEEIVKKNDKKSRKSEKEKKDKSKKKKKRSKETVKSSKKSKVDNVNSSKDEDEEDKHKKSDKKDSHRKSSKKSSKKTRGKKRKNSSDESDDEREVKKSKKEPDDSDSSDQSDNSPKRKRRRSKSQKHSKDADSSKKKKESSSSKSKKKSHKKHKKSASKSSKKSPGRKRSVSNESKIEDEPKIETVEEKKPTKVPIEPVQLKKHVINIDESGQVAVVESFTEACLKEAKIASLKFAAEEAAMKAADQPVSKIELPLDDAISEEKEPVGPGTWTTVDIQTESKSEMWSGWNPKNETEVEDAASDMDIASSDDEMSNNIVEDSVEQQEPVIENTADTYEKIEEPVVSEEIADVKNAIPAQEEMLDDVKLTARQLLEKVKQKRMSKEENASGPLGLKLKNPPSGYFGPKLPPELEKKTVLPLIGKLPKKGQKNEDDGEKYGTETMTEYGTAIPQTQPPQTVYASATTSVAPVMYNQNQSAWTQAQWVQAAAVWQAYNTPYPAQSDVDQSQQTASALPLEKTSNSSAAVPEPAKTESSDDIPPPPPPGVELSAPRVSTEEPSTKTTEEIDKNKDHGILVQYTRERNVSNALGLEGTKKTVTFSDGITPGSEEAEQQCLKAEVRAISPAPPLPLNEDPETLMQMDEEMVEAVTPEDIPPPPASSPPPPPPPKSPPPPPPPAKSVLAPVTTQPEYQYAPQMYYPQTQYGAYAYPAQAYDYTYQQTYMYPQGQPQMYYSVAPIVVQPQYQPPPPAP